MRDETILDTIGSVYNSLTILIDAITDIQA